MTDEIARRAQKMVHGFGLDYAISVATIMVARARGKHREALGTVNEPKAADALNEDEALLVMLLKRRHMPEYAGVTS